MNFLNILSLFLMVVSCKTAEANNENVKLISPAEILKKSNSSIYFDETTLSKEPIKDIRKSIAVNSLKIVTNRKDIGIYDIKTNKVRKKYTYKFESLRAEILRIAFDINQNKTKILVNVSTGNSYPAIIFQIDLNSLEIDWISEYAYQIHHASYANKSNEIALGTSYIKKPNNAYIPEYYASLFTIDSKTGIFLDYYHQGESVEKVKYSDDDKYLFAVLGWPHVDTYVWNKDNKKVKIGAFGKDYTGFYDVCYIDDFSFLTIGADGLYKWNMSDPEDYKIVYLNSRISNSQIFKTDDMFVLINHANKIDSLTEINYFDSKFQLNQTFKIEGEFNNVVLSDLVLTGHDSKNSIIYFDMKNRKFSSESTR